MTVSDHPINTLARAAADTLAALDDAVAQRFAQQIAQAADGEAELVTNRVPACGHLEKGRLVDDAVPGAVALDAALKAAEAELYWEQSCRPDAQEFFNDSHAFVELVGAGGQLRAPDIRFGLFILGPQVFYPSHVHEAAEFYFILSGRGDWQHDDGPFRPLPPGQLFHNVSMQPHAMRMRDEAVIMFWGWHGEITWEKYAFV